MKMKYLSLMTLFFVATSPLVEASAACNPCICGPGGDYQGDIGDWFNRNCGTSGPRRPSPPPKGGSRFPHNMENLNYTCTWESLNCPTGYNCQVDDSEGPFICGKIQE